MTVVVLLLLFIVLLFVSVDAFILLGEWQSRIHIGRWTNRVAWQHAVEERAKKWLVHTPTVRRTPNARLVLIDILRGAYRSATIQTWQDAGLLLGLGEGGEEYLRTHPKIFCSGDTEPEDFLLAYALRKIGNLDKEREQEILKLCQNLRNEGTLCYRSWEKKIRFVDTIGMVVPLLHACGWDGLAKRQIQEYDEALLQGVYPAHAYDTVKHLPLGVFDWSRGVGWYILALVEAPDLEGNDARILKLAEALLLHQLGNGGFTCFIFNQKERFESSGTVLAGLLFISAYRLSRERKFLHAACQAEKVLMKATRRNGALDYCQGDTYGIGYYSRIFSVMPFAQGMALLLSKRIDEVLNENA